MKSALTMAVALAVLMVGAPSRAEDSKDSDPKTHCYVCGSGSTGCDECKFDGHDDAKRRANCEKLGCVVKGTKACSMKPETKICQAAN
ncbi:MAG: hypothetical protein QM765_50655 [Myxococcales bacterium]